MPVLMAILVSIIVSICAWRLPLEAIECLSLQVDERLAVRSKLPSMCREWRFVPSGIAQMVNEREVHG